MATRRPLLPQGRPWPSRAAPFPRCPQRRRRDRLRCRVLLVPRRRTSRNAGVDLAGRRLGQTLFVALLHRLSKLALELGIIGDLSAEAANLLTIPGRVCGNGKPVPVQNADWQRFVQGLRDAGMATYKAGQSKNMDMVIEAADTVTTACMNCHEVYREKTPAQGGRGARCTK